MEWRPGAADAFGQCPQKYGLIFGWFQKILLWLRGSLLSSEAENLPVNATLVTWLLQSGSRALLCLVLDILSRAVLVMPMVIIALL